MLSDTELIELVIEKTPEELSADELDQLGRRIRESAELRAVLMTNLQWETYLHQTLGTVLVSVDEIMATAGESRRDLGKGWGWVLSLVLGLSTLAFLIYLVQDTAPRPPRDQVAADDEPDGPASQAGPGDPSRDPRRPLSVQKKSRPGRPGLTPSDPADPSGEPSDPSPRPQAGASTKPKDAGQAATQLVTVVPDEWRLVREAEDFSRGNLVKDAASWGKDIGIVNALATPAFAEYDVDVPSAGKYKLELRYAAEQKRPVTLLLNQMVVKVDAAAEVTGSWYPPSQKWFTEGQFVLNKGRNVLRLESPGFIPHLDKLALTLIPHQSEGAESPTVVETVELPPEDPATWPELADNPQQLVSWPDSIAGDVHDYAGGLPMSEFKRWVAPVPGHTVKFHDGSRGVNTPVSGFDGLIKLRPTWKPGTVMRLAPFEHHGMSIYFWNGTEGVALTGHYTNRAGWSTYVTKRHGEEPRPSSFVFAGVDEDRYFRTGTGAIEIRHQNGTLLVHRGPVLLLSAPLAQPPSEVYFDNRAWFRNFRLYRGVDFPEAQPPVTQNILPQQSLASLDWQTSITAKSSFRKQAADDKPATPEKPATPGTPDNSNKRGKPDTSEKNNTSDKSARAAKAGQTGGDLVELSIEKKDDKAGEAANQLQWSAFAVPRTGLFEVLIEVEQPSRGTGIYLGHADGKMTSRLAFLRDTTTGWTVATLRGNDLSVPPFQGDRKLHSLPFVGERQLFRLMAGAGCVKCWSSLDGVHWSTIGNPLSNVTGGFTHVGLYAIPGEEPRSIRVRRLEIRELSEVTKFIHPELYAAVPAEIFRGHTDPLMWLVTVIRLQPQRIGQQSVSTVEWRRACAARTLADGPAGPFAHAILMSLLDDIGRENAPVEDRLRAFAQASDLLDAQTTRGPDFISRIEQLGWRLHHEGHPHPFSAVFPLILSTWLPNTNPFEPQPERLLRTELVQAVYSDEHEHVRQFCQVLQLLNQGSQPPLGWNEYRGRIRRVVDWALREPQLQTSLNTFAKKVYRKKSELVSRQPAHPLMVEFSKEGFNTLGEVQAAINEEQYADACQIILSAKPDPTLGLLPDGKDPWLLVSLPHAVSAAMQDHPKLRQTMIDNYGKLGRLRVQQAIAEGNSSGIKSATIQFLGTEAAAEAHIWLGDRALIGGDFATALTEFEQGLLSAGPLQQPLLWPRLRLVGAMLGRDMGTPPQTDVVWNDQRLSSAEFEQLVQEMRLRALGGAGTAKIAAEAISVAPAAGLPPLRYDAPKKNAWKGEMGRGGYAPDNDNDWIGRQLATTVVQDTLYLNNRFQLGAYDLLKQEFLWTQTFGNEDVGSYAWPGNSMRPVVAGEHLFARRLAKLGPEIVCVAASTGKITWRTRTRDTVVSNPLLIQDTLAVLTTSVPHDGMLQLSLTALNPLTGDTLSRRPLVVLHDMWNRLLPCQAIVVGGRIIVTTAANVLCCDLKGQVHWVRRQIWGNVNTTAEENLRAEQHLQPPAVVDGKLYVVQPGVLSVECLDLGTGRRHWLVPISDVRRILGVVEGRVIVETARGLLGLASDTGRRLWFHEAPDLQHGYLLATNGDLCITRNEDAYDVKAGVETFRPCLVWLNTSTGQETARWPLETLGGKAPRVGPFVAYRDRLLLFAGERGEGSRDMYELTPQLQDGLTLPADPPLPRKHALETWTSLVGDAKFRRAAQVILPDWTCLQVSTEKAGGRRLDYQGVREICLTHATPKQPTIWAREVTLPPNQPASLRVQVGYAASERWQFEVLAGGKSLASRVIGKEDKIDYWRTFDVDLSSVAGQTTWIIVKQSTIGENTTAYGYWKRLDIVPEPPRP